RLGLAPVGCWSSRFAEGSRVTVFTEQGVFRGSVLPLLAVVPLEQAYVVANYKETQLERIRPGQPVELEVDTFGRRWRGRVDSVAPASGAVFALLPPDNATGNFTKIVQRFPVRIRLDADAAERGRLLPGMSVIATVDTREPDGASADER
ncbi:HlyD family efflux transporter periplasmic adaptor subunit, partial [Pseudomonas aeruginosa]|uniref:HlyD family secretion protein n=1 Tax=Pseudomonas aeruginosa TaxID=287 RepID=UPI002FDFCD5E